MKAIIDYPCVMQDEQSGLWFVAMSTGAVAASYFAMRDLTEIFLKGYQAGLKDGSAIGAEEALEVISETLKNSRIL